MNFGGGSTQPPVTTSTTTSSPWAGVQPYLGLMYSAASGLQQGGVPQPYQGPTQAPLQGMLQGGVGAGDPGAIPGIYGTAWQQIEGQPGANFGLAQQMAGNIIASNGLTGPVQGALGGLGQTAAQYGDVYNQAQGAANPYLLASIADQNRRGNEAIQSSMSGAGRYGSAQFQDVMARAQAEVADPLLMQDYEARQARALQATQGLGQTYGQQAGIAQQGLGQALQYAQGLGPLTQAQYIPWEMQVGAGQYLQDYAQQQLQGQIQEFNAAQNAPWVPLQMESAILSGAGSLGGTQVTAQTPLQASLASRLIGGSLAGAGLGSAIPGIGTGLGAGVGALAGAFL